MKKLTCGGRYERLMRALAIMRCWTWTFTLLRWMARLRGWRTPSRFVCWTRRVSVSFLYRAQRFAVTMSFPMQDSVRCALRHRKIDCCCVCCLGPNEAGEPGLRHVVERLLDGVAAVLYVLDYTKVSAGDSLLLFKAGTASSGLTSVTP